MDVQAVDRRVDARADRGAGRRVGRDTVVIVAAAALAWALALGAEATGHGETFGHDHLIHDGVPLAAALVLFVLSWQVMLAAMMLPSSLAMLRTFGRLADAHGRPGAARASFVAAYAAVWTAFGLAAFLGDGVLHRTVDAWPWLQAHDQLIWGSVLIGAGAFQFSRLKDRCLTECRTPAGFLVERYRPGTGAAFRVGVAHGVTCVGCCWALMLVAFAAGSGDLVWMAALACVMLLERSTPWGRSIVRPVGAGLIALGAFVVLDAAWLPALLAPR
jgi:predicted metal-binding membrane protein